MKKIVFFLFLISNFIGFSQEDAWIYFKDKPDSDTFFNNPLSELSQRALDRRTTQNIPLDLKDVPINQLYINQISSATGITVMAKSKWLNCVHVRGLQSDINALKSLTSVLKVDFANKSLNLVSRKIKSENIKPINKVLATQVNYNYGNSLNQIKMLKGDLLHQQNYTGSGIIIAVMDGGFPGVNSTQPFQRLRDNKQILGGYDYVNKSTDFYTGISHGTSVLSLMGGFKENLLIGTAPDAQYYLFITEDGLNENPVEESNWVEAAEEADRLGVDIITTSLGYTTFDNTNYDYTYSDMNGTTTFISKGLDIAFSRGIVCVVSAGNDGNKPWQYISAPADAIHSLTIGAVKSDKSYALFSSQGPTFDKRVKPDVMAQGQNPYVSDALGNITNSGSGTSYSCPIIAGMVACLWQAYPNKTNLEIKQLIIQSADKYFYFDPDPLLNVRNKYGYGIPDFSLALANGLLVNSFSKSDFTIYPNPTSDAIFVGLPDGFEVGNTIIYSVLGQKVLEKKTTKQDSFISLKFLNKGTYLYKIETNGFSKSGKILKQ